MRSIGLGLSTKGSAREPNEDCLIVDDQLGLYIVCDGIGGHFGGEVAAREAAREIARYVSRNEDVIEGILGQPDPEAAMTGLGEDAINAASQRVIELAAVEPRLENMGTSLTAVLVRGGRALMSHLGSTRLYLHRGGELHQLSRDHTMAAELARRNLITEDEALDHPFRHILTRSLGRGERELADTLVFDLVPGDRLLLCSNGLSDFVGHSEAISEILEGDDIDAIPEELLDLAESAGGTDDATAVVVRFQFDDETPSDRPSGAVQVDELFAALSRAAVFEGLSLRQLQRLRNISDEVVHRPGRAVLEEGDPVTGLYIVLKGSLAVTRGARAVVELEPADAFGMASLLYPRPARAAVRPLKTSSLLVVPHRRFRILCERFPRMGTILLRRIGVYLCQSVERAQDGLAREAPDFLEEELPAGDLL